MVIGRPYGEVARRRSGVRESEGRIWETECIVLPGILAARSLSAPPATEVADSKLSYCHALSSPSPWEGRAKRGEGSALNPARNPPRPETVRPSQREGEVKRHDLMTRTQANHAFDDTHCVKENPAKVARRTFPSPSPETQNTASSPARTTRRTAHQLVHRRAAP